MSRWQISDRADPQSRAIADRHYNRQKPGTPQFVPPGRCIVLLAADALWVTSWPFAEYVKHAWAGAWVNSAFRKESDAGHASDYIREAVAATRAVALTEPTWERGRVPDLGMVTFIDPAKVRPRMIRRPPDVGAFVHEGGLQTRGLYESWPVDAATPPVRHARTGTASRSYDADVGADRMSMCIVWIPLAALFGFFIGVVVANENWI